MNKNHHDILVKVVQAGKMENSIVRRMTGLRFSLFSSFPIIYPLFLFLLFYFSGIHVSLNFAVFVTTYHLE
jgi:hypothetical protein